MSKVADPDWPVFALENDEDKYELLYEGIPNKDTQGREYEMVDQTIENTDFYQGLNMITVIRRKSDGKLFGYPWWNDISKHGEAYMEENGDDYGIENDTDAEGFDWDTDWIHYFVFEPVVESSLVIYKRV